MRTIIHTGPDQAESASRRHVLRRAGFKIIAAPDMSAAEQLGAKSCAELVDMLSDYHDGRFECGEGDAECIEQHLATCAKCAELLDDYKALSAAAKLLKNSEYLMRELGQPHIMSE